MKDILISSGFSEAFATVLVRVFTEFSVPCADVPSSDWATKILGRPALTLVEWAERNEHLFL